MEKRLLNRRLRQDLNVELEWDAIQRAGDFAMQQSAEGRECELGFQMIGRMIPEQSGRTTLKVHNLLHVGGNARNTFDVTPELADEINNRQLSEGECTAGLAHTHLPEHMDGPSSADLATLREYPETMVGLVLKVRRDGSGVLSVFDGDGHVPYSVSGDNGFKQDFAAQGRGQVDVDRLRGETPYQTAV